MRDLRLALLGHPIGHSLSPVIYKNLLGDSLLSYEMLDIPEARDIPSLAELSLRLDGMSITAPYKKHFFDQVELASQNVREIGAINTIAFRNGMYFGTNTDLVATEKIIEKFQQKYSSLRLVLLGNGSMAKMTKLIAKNYNIPLIQFARSAGDALETLDLRSQFQEGSQTVVINSCARSFIFKGLLHSSFIFWDYNYKFLPHSDTIPSQVASYYDGQEMLQLQAEAALNFWTTNRL